MALAQTRVALRAGRSALRARMAASALCDIGAYVANFEALLRRMWDQHHAGDSGRLLAARAPVVS